jgi:hypothetical protein
MATSPSAQAGNPELMEALYRGGELLGAGKVIEAKDHLERAYQLDPTNEKAQNLLGLSYFKLGLFDRASEIYETLVRDNPADPTLRVNLGLVYLKSSAVMRAVREFEIATDLQPDHQKSHNYLGLALAQAGELGRAREHFLLAGSDVMAEKMARALEETTARAPQPSPPPEPEAPAEAVDASGSAEQVDEVPPLASVAPPQAPLTMGSAQRSDVPGIESISVEVGSGDATQAPSEDPLGAQDWGAQLPYGAGEEAPAEAELRFAEDEGPAAPAAEPEIDVDVSTDLPPVEAAEATSLPVEETYPAAEADARVSFGVDAETSASQEPSAPEAFDDGDAFQESAGAASDDEDGFAISEEPLAPEGPVGTGDPAVPLEEPPVAEVAPEPILLRPTPRKRAASALAPLVGFPQGSATFESGPEGLRVSVRDEIRIRTEGLVSTWGELSFAPEVKHHHGRPTEQPFGVGARRLSRVSGQGALHFEKGAHHFVPIDLHEESVYLREDSLFGLGEGVSYENGRLPTGETSLDLVSASGEGQVLLRLPGELRAVEVQGERPVRVPISAWVGWSGQVLARAVELGTEGRPAIELTGEGYALISVSVG